MVTGCVMKGGAAQPEWRTEITPDSLLSIELPEGYRLRNRFGCWDRVDGMIWREFCLSVMTKDEAASVSLTSNPGCSREMSSATDCQHYEDQTVIRRVIAGRELTVERALLWGTIQHYWGHPAILVRIPLDNGCVAILAGTYEAADRGDEELVRIAGSIRAAGPHRTKETKDTSSCSAHNETSEVFGQGVRRIFGSRSCDRRL